MWKVWLAIDPASAPERRWLRNINSGSSGGSGGSGGNGGAHGASFRGRRRRPSSSRRRPRTAAAEDDAEKPLAAAEEEEDDAANDVDHNGHNDHDPGDGEGGGGGGDAYVGGTGHHAEPGGGAHRLEHELEESSEDAAWVSVQVPMFNEESTCERVIDACCELSWPSSRLQVMVLSNPNPS